MQMLIDRPLSYIKQFGSGIYIVFQCIVLYIDINIRWNCKLSFLLGLLLHDI